ncbi:MAG: EAL domain-containing protein [Betaproteobacteria bacterium]|nr:EAL domain-containing protein [Betaproteobacteria bacterium]
MSLTRQRTAAPTAPQPARIFEPGGAEPALAPPSLWVPAVVFALFAAGIAAASYAVWRWETTDVGAAALSDAWLAAIVAALFIAVAGVATILWWRQLDARIQARRYARRMRRLALEQHYDCFARYANDVVMLLDESGAILEANERALEVYGYGRAELRGMNLRALSAAAGDAGAGPEPARWSADGVLFETEHLKKGGERFPVEVSGRRIEIEGRVFLQGIVRDISERKRIEERLRLGAAVFDSLREGIIVTDARSRIQSVNRAFTAITGYAADEVLGHSPRMLRSDRHDPAFYRAIGAALGGAGYWQGEMWNRRKNGEAFPAWQAISAICDPAGRSTGYLSIFSDLTERKIAEDRITYLAEHDAVTGLPKRALLQERLAKVLAHARMSNSIVAVLCIDMDHLKEVNDTLGHQVGDALMRQIAGRLTEQLRRSDVVGRLAGGEVVKAIAGVGDPAALEGIVTRLLRRLAEPYEVEGHALKVTACAGVALYPEDGADAVTLLRRADTAMHHAKTRGGSAFSYFSAEMEERVSERVAIEQALRHAVERGELRLEYQAKVNAANGRVVGCEALLRWCAPELGEIPPAKFVPIAEETGDIVAIGEWVVSEASRQIRAWRQAGLATVPVAVNVSAVQFRNIGLLNRVRSILQTSGVPALALELEVTEGVLMVQGETTQRTLDTFKSEGFRLSVDDFGSGYSSLGYLSNFPIDSLKIDRSFVVNLPHDPNNVEIVRAVVSLGHALGLRTIAEGVETQEQYEFLREAGCDEVQGYLFSRPLPPEQFARLLGGARAEAALH